MGLPSEATATFAQVMKEQPDAKSGWLRAGQEMLRTSGAASIKLIPLVEVAGKTSGSFYHHYAGVPEFLEDLAATYGTDNANAAISQAASPDPATRLKNLNKVLQGRAFRPLDVAIRDWAGTNDAAADAVERFDATIFEFIEQAFAELGHDRSEARARAMLLFGIAVARMNPPWRGSGKSLDEALALLIERD